MMICYFYVVLECWKRFSIWYLNFGFSTPGTLCSAFQFLYHKILKKLNLVPRIKNSARNVMLLAHIEAIKKLG